MNKQKVMPWLGFILGLFLCGCSGKTPSPDAAGPARAYHEFLAALAATDPLPRLDTPDSQLVSSYDRRGGNNDFNHFIARQPKGWVVIADLKGPGYVSRFWTTGAAEQQRYRFYFDDEPTPRIETTYYDWVQGGKAPFTKPLAMFDINCFFSYLPLTFNKRLVVMLEDWKFPNDPVNIAIWPRVFYQINYSSLPAEQAVASFPKTLSAQDRDAIALFAQAYERGFRPPLVEPDSATGSANVPPGATGSLLSMSGPAVIRRVEITPAWEELPTATARNEVLRKVNLRIFWNDSDAPSVDVPLGDFFGSMWNRTRFENPFYGMSGGTFCISLPMPFEKSARIEVVNQSNYMLTLGAQAAVERLDVWDAALGYLHAGWRKSAPTDIGRPHTVLRTDGRGKLVGCLLSVTSQEKSWWILEGDELIRKDDQIQAGWRGTGLEDYFSGAWYYARVVAFPQHGLLFKAPFRTIQYRFHAWDAVQFNSSVDFTFERGPNHASPGWLESVSYYYLDAPRKADSSRMTADLLAPPPDPHARLTLMQEVYNAERLGNNEGAIELMDAYLETYPEFPLADMLALRKLEYRRLRDGVENTSAAYDELRAAATNELVAQYIDLLQQYHANPDHAVVVCYAAAPAALFLDGRHVGEFGKPDRVFVFPIMLQAGRHALSVYVTGNPYANWVQVALRTHRGEIVSNPNWKYSFEPGNTFANVDFDDSGWKPCGIDGWMKSPPEVPFLWTEPEPFIYTLSRALAIWPPGGLTTNKPSAVMRTVFDLP